VLVVAVWLNVNVEPEGCRLRLSVTDPEDPLDGVMVTV
jgi:hypothetical protein